MIERMSEPTPADERICVTVEEITPDTAKLYLELAPFPLQRKLRAGHVDELATYMRKGVFKPNTTIRFNVVGKSLYLIDGQHRLQAIVESNRPQVFVVLTERVERMEDVEQNYTWIDLGKKRSFLDVAHALDMTGKHALSATRIELIRKTAMVIRHDFEGYRRQTDYERNDRVRFEADVDEWMPYAKRFFACSEPVQTKMGSGMAKPFRTQAVASMGFATVRYQPDRAMAFWRTVYLNDQLKAFSPEHRLASFLMSMRQGEEPFNVYVRRIASCWNAYFRGDETLTKVYAREASLPIQILGTPWKG
jgi:hypothetical protein